MNIGFICGEYPPCNHGGIGSCTRDLAEGMVKREHKVWVIGVYYKQYLKLEEEKRETINGVEVIRLPYKEYTTISYINELLNRFVLHNKLNKLIKQCNIEVVEGYDTSGFLLLKSKVPVLIRLHGSVTYLGEELNRRYSRFVHTLEKIQLKRATLIVGVSNYVLNKTNQYFGVKNNKSIVIHNVAKLPEQQAKLTPKENIILYFGSIHPKKGVEQLIKAMEKVFDKHPDYMVTFAGKTFVMNDGVSYNDYLKNLLPKGYQNKVIFHNHLSKPELTQLILKSKCCVFPSFVECFALSPMEAMALSTPVIYSKLHSGKELIEDGVDGILVDPNNIKELTQNILYLIENPVEASRLGNMGKEKIKANFNYDNWITENENTYKNLINSKK